MDLDYIKIGERLKKVRGKISLVAFSDQFGYSYSYVRSCENGKKPSLEYLNEIVDFFGVSLNWLIYGIEPYNIHEAVEQQKNEVVFDPELKRMIDILKFSMESKQPRRRDWTILQFEDAFRQQCIEYEEKKLNA